jgi:basic membrane protein A
MVTDVGGLGDKSFNDLSWAGLEKAKTDLKIQTKVLESKQIADYESNLTQLAGAGYSPIFAVGFLMTDAVSKIASTTPNTNFGGIDIFFTNPPKNVVGLNFKEQEAGYLAGIVAGLATKANFDSRLNAQNVIGFVGGMPIPPVQRYEAGFVAGAKSVNPTVKVISLYAGKFDDQAKGKELGLSLISQGADIVFAAAGQTGIGTFNACQSSKKALFIGVDSDQFLTLTNPGDTILTSAVKRIDNAVFSVVQQSKDGAFPGGQNLSFGLKDDGVGIAPFHDFETKVPQAIKDAVDKATAAIKAGTTTVPETLAK